MRRAALVLILAAASTSLAAAQEASTELYGDFRYSYNHADPGDSTHWASANNASRLGVRGELTDGGLTAFFDLQTGVNVDAETIGSAFTQRYYFAGVRGGFGAVTIGRQSPAYKMAGLRMDPFYDTSTLSAGGGVPTTGLFAGASFGLSNLTNGFADRTLSYTTPSFGGITANAAAYIDTDSEHDYGVGVAYRAHGFDAGVQYHEVDAGRTWASTLGVDHAVRAHAGYTRPGAWSVGTSLERVEAVTGDTQDFLYAAGTVNLTPRIMLAGGVGHVEDSGAVQPVAGTAFHSGVFYSLFPQMRLHALFSHLSATAGPDRANFGAGLSYQFVLGR